MAGNFLAAGAGMMMDMYSANSQKQFNANQASLDRRFQEKMSSTAHQRAVQDLRKAGLNPILAAGGGASTPSGASASMENPKVGQTGIAAASAYQAMKQSKAEIDLIRAKEKESESSELLNLESAIEAQSRVQMNQHSARSLKAQADKDEITRMGYEMAAPLAEKLKNINFKEGASSWLNSAKNWLQTKKEAVKRFGTNPKYRKK